MGTKYTTQTISGYDQSPPSDDNTVSEANKVKWSTIKTKLPDPVKTLTESINSALVTHFDAGPVSTSSGYTTTAGDYGKVLVFADTGIPTLTLLALASGPDDYHVWVHNKNAAGISQVTVDIDGAGWFSGLTGSSPTSVAIEPGESAHFQKSPDDDFYMIISSTGNIL